MKKLILTFILIHFSLLTANAQWVLVNNSAVNSVSCFTDNGGTYLYAAASGDGVLKTSNYGINWSLSSDTISSYILRGIAAKDSLVFLATNGGLFKSTNYGDNWSYLDSGANHIYATIVFTVNNLLYVGVYYGIMRSSNWGNSWEFVNNGIGSHVYKSIRSFAFSNNILYTGLDSVGKIFIYKSTNLGNNWILISQGIPQRNIPYYLYACDSLILCGAYRRVYFSTNMGINWDSIPGIPGNNGIFGLASLGMKNIFISAWDFGFYVSNDYGKTVTSRNEGLTMPYGCTALYKFGNYLFLGTYPATFPCKIYRRPVSELVGIKKINAKIPEDHKLYQNYPNPFNSNSIIKFQIKDSRFVTLKVYNILGKEIETLVNEKKSAGIYEVNYNASILSSGVYFYNLSVNGIYLDTKKFILIK